MVDVSEGVGVGVKVEVFVGVGEGPTSEYVKLSPYLAAAQLALSATVTVVVISQPASVIVIGVEAVSYHLTTTLVPYP